MKKISLLTLAIVTGFTVMAQETTPEPGKEHKPLRTDMAVKTRFGLNAGVNLAKFNENKFPAGTTIKTNTKTSFHAGGFVNIPLGGSLRFQPGIMWNGYGSKITRTTTGSAAVDYEQDLHYISVPLFLQMQSNSGLYVEAGPQVGFLITANTETDAPDTDVFNKAEFDKLDVAIGAGIGYLTRVGLGFGIRYNFGLTNTLEEFDGKDGPELKNRVFAIGLTYHFGAAK